MNVSDLQRANLQTRGIQLRVQITNYYLRHGTFLAPGMGRRGSLAEHAPFLVLTLPDISYGRIYIPTHCISCLNDPAGGGESSGAPGPYRASSPGTPTCVVRFALELPLAEAYLLRMSSSFQAALANEYAVGQAKDKIWVAEAAERAQVYLCARLSLEHLTSYG